MGLANIAWKVLGFIDKDDMLFNFEASSNDFSTSFVFIPIFMSFVNILKKNRHYTKESWLRIFDISLIFY